jgi:prolyl 4-hydroxylase
MIICFSTRRLACLSLALLLGISDASATVLADEEEEEAAQTPGDASAYTAWDDASWAIKSRDVSSHLGDHIAPLYENYIQGCDKAMVARGHPARCNQYDNQRQVMNKHQPGSVYNYTKLGYQKIRAPVELFDVIQAFYKRNKHRAKTEWADINTYHNMWEAPPTIFHLNQEKDGGGVGLQAKIWNLAKPIMERWTGQMLSPVSLYGIRLYHNNSILAPHVDRMPLVTSAISKYSSLRL